MAVEPQQISWRPEPEERHVQAAEVFLSLIATPDDARRLVEAMLAAPNVTRPAKDVIRAAGVPLLPADDRHVARDLQRIRDGTALSPLMVVRGDIRHGLPLTIADGYHRLCAAFHANQDAEVPCRIANALPRPGAREWPR